jgi:hypothetical protein
MGEGIEKGSPYLAQTETLLLFLLHGSSASTRYNLVAGAQQEILKDVGCMAGG